MGYSKKYSYLSLNTTFDPESHVFVSFYMESNGDFERSAEAIAVESSIGTWTDVEGLTEDIFERLSARVCRIEKESVNQGKIVIAYPLALFETDNIPQLLADVAGNVFGLRDIINLRVRDIQLPKTFVQANPGPALGIQGIRQVMNVYDRPLIGTIIKPKVGLSSIEHAKLAYNAWVGGVDIVKDDENLTDQDFNPFYDRVTITLDALKRAEQETGESKMYCPNISGRLSEMYARAKFVKEMGGKAIMVDVVTVGFSGIQFLRDQDMGLIIHGHRAMHAAFTHSDKHGISMLVIAILSRLAGIDQLHTGTVVGKMEGTKEEILKINSFLRGDWYGIKPTMPIASGGLYPGLLPNLYKLFGKDIIINFGGGIHGHPRGVKAGAIAARQALDCLVHEKNMLDYSLSHEELKEALDLWGMGASTEQGTYLHALALTNGLDLIK